MNQFVLLTLLFISSFCKSPKEKEGLQRFVGMNINSKEVKEYINTLGTKPDTVKFSQSYYYTFKAKGIDFAMTSSDTITSVFLYSEGSDEYTRFKGDIPYNLQFSDTRKIVEQKLGKPDDAGAGGVVNNYSGWNSKGIQITYSSLDTNDMLNPIHHIAIIKKK